MIDWTFYSLSLLMLSLRAPYIHVWRCSAPHFHVWRCSYLCVTEQILKVIANPRKTFTVLRTTSLIVYRLAVDDSLTTTSIHVVFMWIGRYFLIKAKVNYFVMDKLGDFRCWRWQVQENLLSISVCLFVQRFALQGLSMLRNILERPIIGKRESYYFNLSFCRETFTFC